jgi:hypothetical protein
VTDTRWATAKISHELADLVEDVARTTPALEGKSELIRLGIRLALWNLLHRDLITDPGLKLRLYDYLHRHASPDLSSIDQPRQRLETPIE